MSAQDWLGAGSGFAWSFTYVMIIYISVRHKTYAMPMLAMVTNLSWEFLFTFVYPMVGGMVQEVVNVTWLALDAVIVVTFIRFWRSDFPAGLQAWLWPILLGSFAFAIPLLVATVKLFGQDYGSAYTAFADNLMMSVLFLMMLQRRGTTRGQSVWIAGGKLVGTALASVAQYLYDPRTVVLNVMYVEIFVLDALYLYLVLKAPRWEPEPVR